MARNRCRRWSLAEAHHVVRLLSTSIVKSQLDMSSRFKRSQISLAFIAALASPTLLADALERERDGAVRDGPAGR